MGEDGRVGNLTVTERAQIANWFEKHISIDKHSRSHWLGLAPLAHAFTLVIASQLAHKSLDRATKPEVLLQRAWKIQSAPKTDLVVEGTDIDKECLAQQWGLDAGDHQDDWNPYAGTPEYWNHGDRSDSEGECSVSLGSCQQNQRRNPNLLQRPDLEEGGNEFWLNVC